VIGPAPVLALLVGIFHTGLYVLIRGTAGGQLPLLVIAAFLGAWAGDELGARLGFDLLRIGDFRLVSASVLAWVGIGMVAINANDPAEYPEDDMNGMKQRAKQLGMKFPYVVDATSDVARAFGATRTPEALLFDAGGKLVYHGTIDDSPKDAAAVKDAWLKDAVNAVSAGKTVTTAETKAMGCSIKLRTKTTS